MYCAPVKTGNPLGSAPSAYRLSDVDRLFAGPTGAAAGSKSWRNPPPLPSITWYVPSPLTSAIAGPERNCQSSIWRGNVDSAAPLEGSNAPTACWKPGFFPGGPAVSVAIWVLSPPVTIAFWVDPSLPTAVWATAHRNGESVKFEPAPGALVWRVVPRVPFELIVKAGCAVSLP